MEVISISIPLVRMVVLVACAVDVVAGADVGELLIHDCLDPMYWETAALLGVAGGLSLGIVCIPVGAVTVVVVVVVVVAFTGVGGKPNCSPRASEALVNCFDNVDMVCCIASCIDNI